MSTTQQRLDNYIAAEARILARGISQQYGDRRRQEAELETIRKAIVQLKQELAAEGSVRTGGSLRVRTVVFNQC